MTVGLVAAAAVHLTRASPAGVGVGYDRLFVPLCYTHWIIATIPRALPLAFRAAYDHENEGGGAEDEAAAGGWWKVAHQQARILSLAVDAAVDARAVDPIASLKQKVFDKAIEALSSEREREFKVSGESARRAGTRERAG